MIDLRSDLCSVPTDEMWEAMREAELGWATRRRGRLRQRRSASGVGARCSASRPRSGCRRCGMANLAAMLTFCAPGEQVVLEAASHVLTSEAMGITEIARLEPSPLWAPDGRMDPAAVEELVAERHAALLVLENTHTRAGGTTLSARADRRRSRRPRSGTTAACTSTAPGCSTPPSRSASRSPTSPRPRTRS